MASRFIINLLKVLVYYLFLFALCRLCFLLYFSKEIIPAGAAIYFRSLANALHLDISTACYLLFVPLILLFIGGFAANNFFRLLLKGYLVITSIVIISLSIAEIAVYREMHVKLYFNLLSHLAHPAELFQSASYGLMLTVLLLIALVSSICIYIANKLFKPRPDSSRSVGGIILTCIIFPVTAALLVIGCRGGLQPIPINEGEAYFSLNQCVNDATVNPLWNLGESYVENKLVLKGDTYKVMSDKEANEIVNALFAVPKDSTVYLFKTKRPNICILILESWSADVVASCGGYDNLTPNFEKLAPAGYLFTNCKPVGHVSDQGIPGVLSGYPALPIGSAINQPERQMYIPCINNELQDAGYYSSFFFGGQLIYGNIKSYIYRNKFSRVMEQKDFPSSLPAGRLGINDSLMLHIWLDSINRFKQPFFTCLFTLSSHSPFDIPSPYTIDWGGSENPYLNTIIYSDRQLGHFFEEAKKQAWFDSTVFIIVADHSHNVPKNYPYSSPEYYHIPLLIYGGALKEEYRGMKDTAIVSQADIASTLLHQLQLNSDPYRWSKNLMNPYSGNFAFYTFDEGFGFVQDDKKVVWNNKFKYLSLNNAPTPAQRDSLFKEGAAVLQVLMKTYLSNSEAAK